MTTISFDSDVVDPVRRERIYAGHVFAYAPSPGALEFVEFARGLVEEAFVRLDPVEAQFVLPVEKFVEIVAPLVPRFIHHPESKRLIRDVLVERGCDLEKTYFDVPRLHVQTDGGYLSSGVGYTLHPHRDTWYAAPMSQINWWSALYPFESASAMTFFPRYWERPVKNGSNELTSTSGTCTV